MSNRRVLWGRSALLAIVMAGMLGGCSLHRLHWPWKRTPVAVPQPVQELLITPAAGSNPGPISQYWDRNTLLLDLTSLAGTGEVSMHPIEGHDWPVRLEFRVAPGSIGTLEVVGDQRVVFAVPATGDALLLKLAPGAYLTQTMSITLRWSAAGGSAP